MVARKSPAKAAPKAVEPDEKVTATPADVAAVIEREDGSTVPNGPDGIPVLSDEDGVDPEAIAAIEAAADEDLPEPPEQEFIEIRLGSSVQTFLKGHELSVADLLDALDGRTERLFTTKTHILTKHDKLGYPTHYHDPEQLVALVDGDVFTADLRLLG